MGASEDFRHEEFRHIGGARKSYVVWSRREFAALEEMAATLTTTSGKEEEPQPQTADQPPEE
jgi:hypothetical protein